MLRDQPAAKTVGAGNHYDTHGFVASCREMGVTPHVSQNTGRPCGNAIDGCTTRHAGYAISQRIRKWIDTHFGDKKQLRSGRQVKVRGLEKVGFAFTLGAAGAQSGADGEIAGVAVRGIGTIAPAMHPGASKNSCKAMNRSNENRSIAHRATSKG